MKLRILSLVFCVGASEAFADPLLGSHVYDFNSPLYNITTGVQIGTQNSISRTQTAPINVYGVEQVSILKWGQNGGNDASVTQSGNKNVVSVGQTIVGVPGFVPAP